MHSLYTPELILTLDSLGRVCSGAGLRMSNISEVLSRRKDREEGLGQNENALLFNDQNFRLLQSECLKKGTLFCDPTFPADSSSLGYNQLGRYSSKTLGVEWKRPKVGTCP